MPKRLTPDHDAFSRKRRELGITQSELARRTGCLQSAVSMFESGRGGLSDEKILEIARILGVDAGPQRETAFSGAARDPWLKFCPSADCPSNIPYVAHGQVCFLTRPVLAPAGENTRCRLCGEVLEHHCPNVECDAPVTSAAFCDRCGSPYVPFSLPRGESARTYVERRQAELRSLRSLIESYPALGPSQPTARSHGATQGGPSDA